LELTQPPGQGVSDILILATNESYGKQIKIKSKNGDSFLANRKFLQSYFSPRPGLQKAFSSQNRLKICPKMFLLFF
jgi:hypothetical protein